MIYVGSHAILSIDEQWIRSAYDLVPFVRRFDGVSAILFGLGARSISILNDERTCWDELRCIYTRAFGALLRLGNAHRIGVILPWLVDTCCSCCDIGVAVSCVCVRWGL